MPIMMDNELGRGRAKWLHRLIIFLLVIWIPVQILPHLWMFFGMFKGPTEVITLPPSLFPKKFLWENIPVTINKLKVGRNLWNTFVLCAGTILIQIPISSLCAFALSKLHIPGSKALLLFFIGTMMISGQATIIPLYLMMANFPLTHWNFINTFWAVLLPFSAWGWTLFVFKNFFDTLPSSLFEAARIDGAGNLRIFVRIVIPLSGPVFAITIMNTFNAVYNQFFFPFIMMPAAEKWPLMVQIYSIQHAGAMPWNQVMVVLTITAIPMLVVYMFCQRYIVEGIAMTGIKG